MSGARRAAPEAGPQPTTPAVPSLPYLPSAAVPPRAPVPPSPPALPSAPPAPLAATVRTARRGLPPGDDADGTATRVQAPLARPVGTYPSVPAYPGAFPGVAPLSPPTATVGAPVFAGDAEVTRVQPAVRDGSTRETGRTAPAGAGQRGRGRRAEPEKRPTGSKVRGWVLEIVLVLVFALVISALVRAFLFEMFEVPSGSMENTLLNGDRIVAVEVADFHRGDIVVFKDPGGWYSGPDVKNPGPVRRALESLRIMPVSSTDYLVKRLIGLPGDHVQCCDAQGQVTVNGYALDERAYLHSDDGLTTDPPSRIRFDVWVPPGRIFVLGDHRDGSADSRYHLCDTSQSPPGMLGFVPIDNVVGPVKAIAVPLTRIQRFQTPATFAGVPDPPAGQAQHPNPVVFSDQCPG